MPSCFEGSVSRARKQSITATQHFRKPGPFQGRYKDAEKKQTPLVAGSTGRVSGQRGTPYRGKIKQPWTVRGGARVWLSYSGFPRCLEASVDTSSWLWISLERRWPSVLYIFHEFRWFKSVVHNRTSRELFRSRKRACKYLSTNVLQVCNWAYQSIREIRENLRQLSFQPRVRVAQDGVKLHGQ